LFCLLAKEYGYKGVEVADFLGRDPGAVTKYLQHGAQFGEEMEKAVSILKK
jgi:predicted transcriptional regulator